jgi:hypothetical protein
VNLLPGEYQLGFILADLVEGQLEQVEGAVSFTVGPADVYGSGVLPGARDGKVFLRSSWRCLEGHGDAKGEVGFRE